MGKPVDGDETASGNRGFEALINSARIDYDRLPMLEVLVDRHVRLLMTELRPRFSDSFHLVLLELRSVRFGDYLNWRMGPECALAIFECVTWRHYGLIAADRPALDLMADAAPDRPTPFPTVAEIVLTTLEQASEPIAPGTFRLDRLETDPRFACIDRPANAVFLCRFGLHFGGRSAHLDLLLPYAALEPVRSRLRQMFRGEKFGCDAHWAAGLRAHLPHVGIRPQIVIGPAAVTLSEALAWRSGSTVVLGHAAVLMAGGAAVAEVEIGRSRGGWAVRLGRILIDQEKPMMDDAPENPALKPADLPVLPAIPASPPRDLSALGKVRLRVSAVLGGVDMTIDELLKLGRGAVLELDRRVGEMIDIQVNDRIVAKGEIVVVEDRIAVALKELLDAAD